MLGRLFVAITVLFTSFSTSAVAQDCPEQLSSALTSFQDVNTRAHQFSELAACASQIGEAQKSIADGNSSWGIKGILTEINLCSCGAKAGAQESWYGLKALFDANTYRAFLMMIGQPGETLKGMGETLGDIVYSYHNELDGVQAQTVRCAFWTKLALTLLSTKGAGAAIKQARETAIATADAIKASRVARAGESAVQVGEVNGARVLRVGELHVRGNLNMDTGAPAGPKVGGRTSITYRTAEGDFTISGIMRAKQTYNGRFMIP